MRDSHFYLRQNVMVEPLVDHWYAWGHLIPPATAAMNMVGRHFRILESYIRNPDLHAAATKDPAMLGGPFVDYRDKRVEQAKGLLAETTRQRSRQLALAAAIQDLDRLLQSEARGQSLDALYAKVPEPLKGYVELVYDLNNQPSFRLIEPLLYRSPYYAPDAQSLMLSLIHADDRPFILSTPRLATESDVHWKTPFAAPKVDEFFRAKNRATSLGTFEELLEVDGGKLMPFLSKEAPSPYEKHEGPNIRWRYFGHACLLLEVNGRSILVDPVLSYTYESEISRYTYEDLPDRIDWVLITHNHQDHVLVETMIQLRHKIERIVVPRNGGGALQDPCLRQTLEQIGFNNVVDLDEFHEVAADDVRITALPFFGEHADLNVQTKSAYLLEAAGRKLMLAADACNLEPRLYEHVHRWVGDLDVLFVGMECDGAPLSWLYGPLLTRPLDKAHDRSRRLAGCNYPRAWDLVQTFKFKEVYVYAMGQEPWLNYVMSLKYDEFSNPIVASNRLIEKCREAGIQAERLFGEKELTV